MTVLRLFGGIALEGVPDHLVGGAAQQRRLALLAVLGAAQPRAVRRDKLLALLWPESDTAHARNLLNQAVHAIRKALGPASIRSAGDGLLLAAEIPCDVRLFREALAAGDLEAAVRCHAGPFLDGFFVQDAAEFSRWSDAERAGLRAEYLRALEALAERDSAGGDAGAAVGWWRRLAAEEPYPARVAVGYMLALEAAGDTAGAIRHARSHASLLREELDAEPSPEVVELAERMRHRPAAGPAFPAPRPASPLPSGAGAAPPEAPSAPAPSARRFGWMVLAAGLALAVLPAAWPLRDAEPAGSRITRLAVLPLANLTGDPGQEYFVAGMHDALIAELGKLSDLTVISRQSVLRYRDSDRALPRIAREVGVEGLVEGSVLLFGDSVRITAQLVSANPERHLWADSYHGALGEALALQGQVARAIARAIHAQLGPGNGAPAVEPPRNPAAQQAYLQGLFHVERQAIDLELRAADRIRALRTAMNHFEAAVAIEPEWAAAHARLAQAYAWLASSARVDHAEEYFPLARVAVERALVLDPKQALAHATLGVVRYQFDWDWAGAEAAFGRAMALDPHAHHEAYAGYLMAAGRHDEALVHYRMAEERNPLSDFLKREVAEAYKCAGRHEEAIAKYQELESRMGGKEQANQWVGARVRMAFTYASQGRHDEALAMLEEAVALTDSLRAALVGLAYGLARAGRVDEARALTGRLEATAGPAFRPAHLYAALGDTDQALGMMEEVFRRNRTSLANLRCLETWALLRHEPRMQAIAARIGFPRAGG